MKNTLLVLGIILSCCMASDEALIRAFQYRLSCADKAADAVYFDYARAKRQFRTQIVHQLQVQSDFIKHCIHFIPDDADFFEVNPTKSAKDIENEVAISVNDKLKPEYLAFRQKFIQKNPLLHEGLTVTLETRMGPVTGKIVRISNNLIKIGSRTISFIDLSKDALARLDQDSYEQLIQASWWSEKHTATRFAKEFAKQYSTAMLRNGYLPIQNGHLTFDFTKHVQWFSRHDLIEHLCENEKQKILQQAKDNFCKDNYNMSYQQIVAQIEDIKVQIQERNSNEKSRGCSQSFSRSSQGAKTCADCMGTGKKSIRQCNGQYVDIKCSGCNGTGRAGFATDYIDNSGRHRSQMDQILGGMMGAF